MKIHTVYSQAHYGSHLDAIHRHLPDGLRGSMMQEKRVLRDLPPEDLVMIAGYSDLVMSPQNRIIFVEHGAGQRYVGLPKDSRPFYGGPYPDRVIAYLGPRQAVVDSVGLPGVAMGSPVCDPYELYGEPDVCAITWHWKARGVCPEADSALNHYAPRLGDIIQALRDRGWKVLGHRHPRLRGSPNLWKRHGVEEVNVETVRRRASLLIADNTSLAYEMAYLGRANISLNAPWYRRDVEHGLRFWADYPGMMVDGPDELIALTDADASCHTPGRTAMAAYGNPMSDGNDGLRAAAWLTSFAAGL